MSFSGSVVEFASDGVALGLRETVHAYAFRKVLANEAVGVLVRSAFPRVIRCGEVEGDGGCTFDVLVSVELASVVSSDGLEPAWILFHETKETCVGRRNGAIAESTNDYVSGLSVDSSEDAASA